MTNNRLRALSRTRHKRHTRTIIHNHTNSHKKFTWVFAVLLIWAWQSLAMAESSSTAVSTSSDSPVSSASSASLTSVSESSRVSQERVAQQTLEQADTIPAKAKGATQQLSKPAKLYQPTQSDSRAKQATLTKFAKLTEATAFAKAYLRDPKQTDAAKRAQQIFESLLATQGLPKAIRKTAQNNLAVLLIEQQHYHQAQQLLLQALREEAWVATTLDNLNQLYAYEAQQAYQEVFAKSVLQTPKGQLLSAPQPVPKVSSDHSLPHTPQSIAPKVNE